MFNLSNMKVLMHLPPVDMRKSINGLSILVTEVLKENPTSEQLFVFRNKSSNKIKLLYWERDGFWLFYKRLEKSRFKFPKMGDKIQMTMTQMRWLLDGLDIGQMKERSELNYQYFY
jgi:transposase